MCFDGNRSTSIAAATLLNAGFGLKGGGDRLYFYGGNGSLIDSAVFGLQLADKTIARVPNGSGAWTLGVPTFGSGNTAVALASALN